MSEVSSGCTHASRLYGGTASTGLAIGVLLTLSAVQCFGRHASKTYGGVAGTNWTRLLELAPGGSVSFQEQLEQAASPMHHSSSGKHAYFPTHPYHANMRGILCIELVVHALLL